MDIKSNNNLVKKASLFAKRMEDEHAKMKEGELIDDKKYLAKLEEYKLANPELEITNPNKSNTAVVYFEEKNDKVCTVVVIVMDPSYYTKKPIYINNIPKHKSHLVVLPKKQINLCEKSTASFAKDPEYNEKIK